MQDKAAILPGLATDSKLDLRSIPGPKTLEEKEAFRGKWGPKLLEHAQVWVLSALESDEIRSAHARWTAGTPRPTVTCCYPTFVEHMRSYMPNKWTKKFRQVNPVDLLFDLDRQSSWNEEGRFIYDAAKQLLMVRDLRIATRSYFFRTFPDLFHEKSAFSDTTDATVVILAGHRLQYLSDTCRCKERYAMGDIQSVGYLRTPKAVIFTSNPNSLDFLKDVWPAWVFPGLQDVDQAKTSCPNVAGQLTVIVATIPCVGALAHHRTFTDCQSMISAAETPAMAMSTDQLNESDLGRRCRRCIL